MKTIPQLQFTRALRRRGTFLAALAALAVVAPLRADTITYDFDDGTAQGWTNVLTSPNDPPTAYEPSSRSDAAAAAQSGSFRIIPQIAGPFSPTEDSPHNTLVFRSPEFTLGPSGSISLFLNIGHGFGPGLVANFVSLPASSSTFGFEGVGLRRVSDGAYVLSARRSEFGVDAWTPVVFSNASIVANGLVGTPLTLDLIDYCDGPWGWVALDTVTLYDAVPVPLVAAIPDQLAAEGVAFVGPTPVLIRGDAPITWLLMAGPAGMAIDPTNGVVSWNTPVFAGSPYSVTIRATNATGDDDESFLLTVRPADSGAFRALWEQITTTGNIPSPRYGASLVFVPNPDRLVLFGGADGYDVSGSDFSDLRVLDVQTRIWTSIPAVGVWPQARHAHAAVYDAERHRMLVFSGYYAYGNYLNDLWALDLNTMTWGQLSPGGSVPSQRRGMASALDTVRAQWLLFGGFIHVGNFFDDLFYLDPADHTFTEVPQGVDRPQEALWATMTYLPASDQVVLFGGMNLDWYGGDWRVHTLRDTWFLERPSNTWSQVQSNLWAPPSRSGHVAFPYRGRYLGVFGGLHADEPGVAIGAEVPLSDLWIFDPATRRWEELSPTGAAPSARGVSAAAVDTVQQQAFVFGGTDWRGEFYNDLYMFTLTSGTNQPPVILCTTNILTTTNLSPSAALVAFSVSATGVPAPAVTCTFGGSLITSPHAFTVGTNAVTCTATSAAGTNTCTFTVTVVDTIPPVTEATVDSGFNPGASGGRHVLALAVQRDGKILVGGDFSTLGGQPRNMIGRLNSNGTLDTSFNPGADNWVYALAVQEDGKILVGGFLTWLGGQARYHLGRLNPDGTLDTSFDPGADGQVLCFALQADGKILVGGRFTTLGGEPRSRIARLNADGTLDPSFNPGANSGVLSIALQPDGKIVVGGEFTVLAGHPCERIGRFNADGTMDPTFNPGANSTVQPIAVQADGKILVGGYFTIFGGQPRNWIGRLNADGNLDTSFNPGADNLVASFAVQADGKILAGGFFTTLGGQPRNYLGRLNADGTLDTSFNPGTDFAGVYALAEQADGKILLGGSFTVLGGQPRDHIARLNNTGPVTESLTYDGSAITWLRGGTAPEVWRTSFAHSTNGTAWTPLGAGARLPGGWQLTGAVLPPGTIRARGHVTGGYLNGSGWFVETITVRDNTPPMLQAVPDLQARVLTALWWTNAATDLESPPQRITYSLDPGAPAGATVNPTNGLFRWRPTPAYGNTTNWITVRATDNGVPPLAVTRTFAVAVADYVEPSLGTLAIQAGSHGCVPMVVMASTEVTNLSAVLHYDETRLTNLDITILSPLLSEAELRVVSAGEAQLALRTHTGFALLGTQEVARLCFDTLPERASAFTSLTLSEVTAQKVDGTIVHDIGVGAGRLAFVGEAPLLEAALASPSSVTLSLYGTPGVHYVLETTTDLTVTGRWNPSGGITLSNLMQTVAVTNLVGPAGFWRAVLLGAGAHPVPGPRFVWLPPGQFTMGSPVNEQDRSSIEGPQTRVTLTRGFFMGRYEVTQGEFLAVTGSNPSNFTGNTNRPVENLTWYDVTNYCAQLTQQEQAAGRLPTGWAYRLPTEAEWEYACRAGTTNRFYYGNDPDYTQLGNYAWFSVNGGGSGGPPYTVGAKLPNPWGLYDMHGNVWEWCSDRFGEYLGGSVTDPQGPDTGYSRVLRGGSWWDSASDCRSATRGITWYPDSRYSSFGMRVVLAPGQP